MPAAKGNKYAEKWTPKTVIAKVEEINLYNKENPKNYHFGLALIECGLSPQWWSQMCEKFKDNQKVLESLKRCEKFLEARIINSTLSGDAKSAAMAIFYLKNKHGYRDKTEQEIEHKGQLDVKNITFK